MKLQEHTEYTDFEEVDDNTDQPAPINVDKETGEVKEKGNKQPDASDVMDFWIGNNWYFLGGDVEKRSHFL